jgi:tricorn protease-like protein
MTSAWAASGSEKTIPLDDHVYQFSVGRRLVYTQVVAKTNIWRARIPAAGEPAAVAEVFLSSTRADSGARYSPDGKKISFTSLRSGSSEIWIANPDGSNATRMTSFGGPAIGHPAWSPDGQWLVLHARPEGQADLFVMPAAGGSPKRLTNHPADDIQPVYSRDGRWIYFSSFRTGQWQIWKIPVAGGVEVRITESGGLRVPVESPDGKLVYSASASKRAIWQVPAAGGAETQVVAPVHPSLLGFEVTKEGIYYPGPPHSVDRCYIRFFSFSTGQDRPVVLIGDSPFGFVVSVSPDERFLLFHKTEKPGMDLMLVEDFRLP